MNFLVLAFVFELPAGVAAGGLRALKRPPVLQPLQRPPPATADAVFAQLEAYAPGPAPGPAGSPAGSPGGPAPGPITMPPPPQLAAISAGSCMGLQNVVAQIVGAPTGAPGPGPAPGPAPGAPAPGLFLMQEATNAAGPAPAAAGGPTVECRVYAIAPRKPAGCNCFIQSFPPPAVQPKVNACPMIPNAFAMGFTGNPVSEGPYTFPQTGGVVSRTCSYRQWIYDPTVDGPVKQYQKELSVARTQKYIKDTYSASLMNAQKTASAYYALTPVPWLQLFPTTPWPGGGTSLNFDAPAGTNILDVGSTAGFIVGREVVIAQGKLNEEYSVVQGFGSLVLGLPLKYMHFKGETVIQLPTGAQGGAPGPAPGGLFNGPTTPPVYGVPPTTTNNPYFTTTNLFGTTTGMFGATTTGYGTTPLGGATTTGMAGAMTTPYAR